ncbi:hypothetical protein ACIA5C_37175 [Actinoplanes sp. NPDC051343]|uniref:hypothetical protein n=1 Tax=Actinoplanes sp. NPDC051343 TaxID=3363906 RepID=UPI0037AE4D08
MTKILDPTRTDLYTTTGLRRLGSRLRPGGAFGLWSDDAPGRDLPRQRRYPGPADLDEAVRAFEERKWARADKWAKMRRRPARDAW